MCGCEECLDAPGCCSGGFETEMEVWKERLAEDFLDEWVRELGEGLGGY